MRPVWAEIDLSAIRDNCRTVRQLVKPGTKIMAVVKANGYGHGAVQVAEAALAEGAGYLGVATQKEALELREAGIEVPILILGFTPPEDAAVSVSRGITQTVFSLAQGEALSRTATEMGLPASVHVKIDTGMGRIGFAPREESVHAITRLMKLPGIRVEGIFTHLAKADSRDKIHARQQIATFNSFLKELKNEGVEIPIVHAANSAAIMELPEAHYDLVRAGIMLYGLYPSPEMNRESVRLRPALSWHTRIVHVKEVPAGTPISYGGTYVTRKKAKIATLPLGYADGLMRLLSNRGQVLLRGQKVPIAGRVCMDQTMVDVTELEEVAAGDLVTIIGRQGREEITADHLADKVGTINYEIVCAISGRVTRHYIP